MNLFDHNNPRHMAILKEELARAKSILTEASSYSADKIWGNMTLDDRRSALYVAKSPNPDDYIDGDWDSVPAEMQDLIDLSEYEPASMSQTGRSLLRGTVAAMKEDPHGNHFVMKYLRHTGKAAIEQLTVSEIDDLNAKLWRFVKRNQNNVQTLGGPTPDEYSANRGRGNYQGD